MCFTLSQDSTTTLLANFCSNIMGNYWSHACGRAPAQSQSYLKYYYTSIENLNMDDLEEESETLEDQEPPNLPTEVWSEIIVQLSFSDKVGGRGLALLQICFYF